MVFISVLSAVAVAPYVQIEILDRQIEEDRVRLMESREELRNSAALTDENKKFAVSKRDAGQLLEGKTTGIAGAALQKRITRVVRNYGGIVSSAQILQPEKDKSLTRIAVSLTTRINIDGLRNFLYDLETGMPVIFIDDITVRSSEEARKAGGVDFLGPLDVTMTVRGFAKVQGASGT